MEPIGKDNIIVLKMASVITWVSIIVIILAFIFFIVSVIILEFGVKTNKNGDIIIPWYYWLFFVGSGVLFLTYVILLAFPHTKEKKISEKNKPPEDNWEGYDRLQGDENYRGNENYRRSDLELLGYRSR